MSTQDENTPDISIPDITPAEQHERIMASMQKINEKIDRLLGLYYDTKSKIDALMSTIHTKPTKKQRDLLVSRHTYIKDGVVMVPTIIGGTASNPQMEWKPRD